jgi:hypothetical protein
MDHQIRNNPLRGLGLLLLLLAGNNLLNSPLVQAHETEVSGEVGGTIHIEPNDSPTAGSANLAWFALTRRGGQAIPLSDCNCNLAVYAVPHHPDDPPIQSPPLTTMSAEGKQGVPGATITFPRPGAYELILQGRPVTSGTFTPFELKFPVVVAR